MESEKDIVYSESEDYFPAEIRKKFKLGEYTDKDTFEGCGGIESLLLLEKAEKKESLSKEKEAEIRRRLCGRAAEYLMFLDD